MAVMACKENIVDGHVNGFPFVTAAAKAGHDLLVVGAFTRSCWDHMRYRFAVAGNGHARATLDCPEEFCQTCLGLGSLYGAHRDVQPVNITKPKLSCGAQSMQPVTTQCKGAIRYYMISGRVAGRTGHEG